MKYELAIAVADEQDLASGHKRKKKGDIIAIKPYPWNWGTEELKHYLIVIVDGLTEKEVECLTIPYYKDGQDVSPIATGETKPHIPIAKRKYKVPLTAISKDIDLDKVKDKNLAYQPLKDKDISFDAKSTDIIFNKHENDYVKSWFSS